VYIAEAHASDAWPVGAANPVRQHTSTAERIGVAQERLAELGVEGFLTLIDKVETDEFHKTYACWPFRWYTVGRNSRTLTSIAYPAKKGGHGYDVSELLAWITDKIISA